MSNCLHSRDQNEHSPSTCLGLGSGFPGKVSTLQPSPEAEVKQIKRHL